MVLDNWHIRDFEARLRGLFLSLFFFSIVSLELEQINISLRFFRRNVLIPSFL